MVLNKILNAILLISLIIILSSGACISASPSITDISPSDGSAVSELSSLSFNFSMGSSVDAGYTIYAVAGCRILDLDDYSIAGDIDYMDVYINGSYSFDIDDSLLVPNSFLPVNITARRFNLTTGVYDGYFISEEILLDYKEPEVSLDEQYHMFYDNAVPVSYDTSGAYDFMKNGNSLDVSCLIMNSNYTAYGYIDRSLLYTIVCVEVADADYSTVIASGTREHLRYATSDTYIIDGHVYHYGRTPEHFENLYIPDDYNISYYLYTGLSIAIDEEKVFFHTDDTVNGRWWSADGSLLLPSTKVSPYYSTYSTYRLFGSMIYVPGTEFPLSSFTSHGFEIGSLGNIIHDYGNSIGMPFFFIFIVFAIVGICASMPYAFAVRYSLEFNNYIYGGAVILGVVISFGVGLINFMMLGVFFAAVMFVCMYRFREHLHLTWLESRYDVMPKMQDYILGRRDSKKRKSSDAGIERKPVSMPSWSRRKKSVKLTKPVKVKSPRMKKRKEPSYVRSYYRGGGLSKKILVSKRTGRKIKDVR